MIRGTQIWDDNSKYEGEWENGQFNGYGIYYYSNGEKYIGEWKNSLKDGVGELVWPEGKKYVGYFKNDEMNGIGIYYLYKDCYIINFWKKGKRDGLGKYIKGNDITYGKWKENNLIKNMNESDFFQLFIDDKKKYLNIFKWDIKEIEKFMKINQ